MSGDVKTGSTTAKALRTCLVNGLKPQLANKSLQDQNGQLKSGEHVPCQTVNGPEGDRRADKDEDTLSQPSPRTPQGGLLSALHS